MQCFSILNDAIFARFLDKTSTSMFLTMFDKTQNIMLTMHISDVFQTIKKIPKNFPIFFNFELQS